MFTDLTNFYITLYYTVLTILLVYGLHRLSITLTYYQYKKNHPQITTLVEDNLPPVLIQLPVYNEKFVIQRLITHVCAIDYPQHLLYIQVLDDSTDECSVLAQQSVQHYQAQGFNIHYIHRVNRVGFKAGALDVGMQHQPMIDFIAIFDADFLPKPQFLKQMLPYFSNPKVGMVQSRWTHLNREHSLLTHIQAIMLDGHFMIEHTARNRSGCFFNFNGTAGIWRTQCIMDAGGWQHDTLTEDLDLSYRAQLLDWSFVFVNQVTSPAELPIEMNAFKNQQHRWAKGSIQVAKKLLPQILTSTLPWKIKIEALFHLGGNFAYLYMLVLLVVWPQIIIHDLYVTVNHYNLLALLDLLVLLCACGSVLIFYAVSQKEVSPKHYTSRLKYLPYLIGVGVGLTFNNSKATLEALLGYRSPFIRTPKWASIHTQNSTSNKFSFYKGKRGFLPYIEILFVGYYLYATYHCILWQRWFSLPLLLLFLWGMSYVSYFSLISHTNTMRTSLEYES